MIQRVQSLFLLAVALLMIVFLFVPIWKKEVVTSAGVKTKVQLCAFNVTQTNVNADNAEAIVGQKSTWYIGALAIVCAGIALFSIFQYHHRMNQIKLGLLNTLLICGILGLIFLGVKEGDTFIADKTGEKFQFGFFVPAMALLFNSLSNRFIKKDEQLVRSADRIR